MHWTVDALTIDTTLPTSWLTPTRKLAAYVHRQGITQTQRSMWWPTDTEQTLKLCTASLQTHINKLQGMHRPWEGHGLA